MRNQINEIFFLKPAGSESGNHTFDIFTDENSVQRFIFQTENSEISFTPPFTEEYSIYMKNINNLKKILKSRFLTDSTDTGLLPVVFPEKPVLTDDFPADAACIYCDGSRNRHGNGGWAYITTENTRAIHSGNEKDSDSCRMELMAVVMGIKNTENSRVIIHTDSRYVKHGMEAWLPVWELNNYTTASNKPAKNRDLWELLSELKKTRILYWKWIKSGSGNFMHDSCHNEAKTAADKCGKISL